MEGEGSDEKGMKIIFLGNYSNIQFEPTFDIHFVSFKTKLQSFQLNNLPQPS